MIICPKCNGHAEFSSYFQKYQCLSKYCNWHLDPRDMTDEDKLYFNRQERCERWELDDPVKDIEFVDGTNLINIYWKDGTYQCICKYDLLKAVLKVIKNEIKK